MEPVLEVANERGFSLWPVDSAEPSSFMALNGMLAPSAIGTAVMSIAWHNSRADDGTDSFRSQPLDPIGELLHGLLTTEDPFVAGGLRVVDNASGAVLLPGCCNGLEERGDWRFVVDGRGGVCSVGFGHDPDPAAERAGDRVRLFVDSERDDSPVFDVPVEELKRLLEGAERDLADFLELVPVWAAEYVPSHASELTAAVARALVLAGPGRSA